MAAVSKVLPSPFAPNCRTSKTPADPGDSAARARMMANDTNNSVRNNEMTGGRFGTGGKLFLVFKVGTIEFELR